MFLEFEHCDPTGDKFSDLSWHEKEFYRAVIQRLLLLWNLILKARADLESRAG